jgi:hypothetical protein
MATTAAFHIPSNFSVILFFGTVLAESEPVTVVE